MVINEIFVKSDVRINSFAGHDHLLTIYVVLGNFNSKLLPCIFVPLLSESWCLDRLTSSGDLSGSSWHSLGDAPQNGKSDIMRWVGAIEDR